MGIGEMQRFDELASGMKEYQTYSHKDKFEDFSLFLHGYWLPWLTSSKKKFTTGKLTHKCLIIEILQANVKSNLVDMLTITRGTLIRKAMRVALEWPSIKGRKLRSIKDGYMETV